MLGLDKKSPAFRLSFPVCCLSVSDGGGEPARRQDAMPRPHHLSIDRHLNTTRLWVRLVAFGVLPVCGSCGRNQDARGSFKWTHGEPEPDRVNREHWLRMPALTRVLP